MTFVYVFAHPPILRRERRGNTTLRDSTKLAICHNKRTSNNRVFSRLAKDGVSSYGYFLGFYITKQHH